MFIVRFIENLNSRLIKAGKFLDELDSMFFIFFMKYICPVLLVVSSFLLNVMTFISGLVSDLRYFRIFCEYGFKNMKIFTVCFSLFSLLYVTAEILLIKRNRNRKRLQGQLCDINVCEAADINQDGAESDK